MKVDRRTFLKISLLTAHSLFVSTGLSACGGSTKTVPVAFLHGVASGDPLQNSVILWTRATPLVPLEKGEIFDIDLEVSIDPEFVNIIRRERLQTSDTTDFTIKVDVQNLEPNHIYYYRFRSGDTLSLVGRTKTLPDGNMEKVKIAVFTGSNYTNGYFNAYKEASKIEDLDVALHVGDYIYEYGMFEADSVTPAYATEHAKRIGRELPPDNDKELLKLEDYRKRYALYHEDPDTQALHRAVPMIAVWDDHEIANDAYKDGAENHNEGEGDYHKRVEAALQAYFEWMPIRNVTDRKKIFRAFHFGDLVSLYMFEERVSARDKQLDFSDYLNELGEIDLEFFTNDLFSPGRTILGEEQKNWLYEQMESSSARWQVFGQQVVMGKMHLPEEIVNYIVRYLHTNNTEEKEALQNRLAILIFELTLIKLKKIAGIELSDEEEKRISTTLPFNLDAWDGYAYHREEIFSLVKDLDKKIVVLSGDSHHGMASNLRDENGDMVGVELVTPAVTSPGLERLLGLKSREDAKRIEKNLTFLIEDLHYINCYDKGFMVVEFTPTSLISRWYFVDNYYSKEYSLLTDRMKTLKIAVDHLQLD